jgi:hypothetical protein
MIAASTAGARLRIGLTAVHRPGKPRVFVPPMTRMLRTLDVANQCHAAALPESSWGQNGANGSDQLNQPGQFRLTDPA